MISSFITPVRIADSYKLTLTTEVMCYSMLRRSITEIKMYEVLLNISIRVHCATWSKVKTHIKRMKFIFFPMNNTRIVYNEIVLITHTTTYVCFLVWLCLFFRVRFKTLHMYMFTRRWFNNNNTLIHNDKKCWVY